MLFSQQSSNKQNKTRGSGAGELENSYQPRNSEKIIASIEGGATVTGNFFDTAKVEVNRQVPVLEKARKPKKTKSK